MNSLGEPVSHGPSLLRYLPKLPSVSDAARGLEEARGWLSRWLVPSTSDSHTPAQELKIRVEREVTTTEERSTDSAVPEVTTTEERSTDSAVPEV
ncbi:hypothetical protein, partial [Kitasatospora sp. NPDC093102]|uniref:hypothetical protein n=1 Tax=Kitasatospora sp. NPDC093102 TaxID=3155069 RepID=UPI0034128F2C